MVVIRLNSILTLFLCGWIQFLSAQNCGDVQVLNGSQSNNIKIVIHQLDSLLKVENQVKIDSISSILKNDFGLEGGKPDAQESYYNLTSSTDWLDLSSSISLSRLLIDKDSLVYSNLWKSALGSKPPSYQPNSLFLRSSAEIASGLLKIAQKETDVIRKNLYTNWAIRSLDSLATMQLPNGAFPFPDLRMYGDPTFSSIINHFMVSCGSDSVNVIKNGWIIDDKGTGEFKFDAGIIANAYYEAFLLTNKIEYKSIVISMGDYFKTLTFNSNYNYNTFVSLGLTRAYQLTNDVSYLNRAIQTIRLSVLPGQLSNGRWVDGHNANSRYHSIILQNCLPTNSLITTNKQEIDNMNYLAVKNMLDYTYKCGASTGFRWLMKAYSNQLSLYSPQFNDSLKNLIGRYINQSNLNGKYLDVPSMGEYLELLDFTNSLNKNEKNDNLNIYPNPFDNQLVINSEIEGEKLQIKLINSIGVVEIEEFRISNLNQVEIDTSKLKSGIYFLQIEGESGKNFKQKFVKF